LKIKRNMSIVGICACILSGSIIGCAKATVPVSETVKLEPYYENDAKKTSIYENLILVELGNEDISIKTYLPIDDKMKQDEMSASSEKDGVSVELSLLAETEKKNAGNIMEEVYKKEKERISKLENIQDFKVYDLEEYDGYWMLEMDYSLHDGNGTLYPCISIIKLDELDEGFLLSSIIRVDNSTANENTGSVLKETMDVYGIHMK
jgi:hypothetical protein